MASNLYGGAITANIPADLLDASLTRPVPDTQEVYTGEVDGKDVALIVDLLEQVEGHKSLVEAAQIHIDDVHHMAGNGKPDPIETVTETINGHETVLRREALRTPADDLVLLTFGLFRLHPHGTDVLVTYTTNVAGAAQPPELASFWNHGRRAVVDFIASFHVADAKLFAEEEAEHHHQHTHEHQHEHGAGGAADPGGAGRATAEHAERLAQPHDRAPHEQEHTQQNLG